MKPDTTEPAPLWKRLAWFALLWTASVVALGAVSLLIRAVATP